MVILRTHVFGDRERSFAGSLMRDGTPFVIAADETRGILASGPYEKISITRDACQELGLYCPENFTWRNGDYALYLARHQFPHVEKFWMVEADVEHSFPSFADLLALFEPANDADLLTSYLRPAEPDWYWHQTMKGQVYRSFFPLIRLSAKAIDVCLARRKRERFSLRTRLHWPNDEVFVATTVIQSGMKALDFNHGDIRVYTEETFRYDPLNGDDPFFRTRQNQVFHAVLYGEAYLSKVARLSESRDSYLTRAGRKLQRMV